MNSFTFLRRGIEAEIARQIGLLESGERVVQETLHFDHATGELHPLRSKEEAHDYRYFPEPDLVPLAPDPAWVAELRASLPELPVARRRRYQQELGLSFEDAEVLTETPELSAYLEQTAALVDPKLAANGSAVTCGRCSPSAARSRGRATSRRAARQADRAGGGRRAQPPERQGGRAPRDRRNGGDPAAIVEERGLAAIGAGDELRGIVEQASRRTPGRPSSSATARTSSWASSWVRS